MDPDQRQGKKLDPYSDMHKTKAEPHHWLFKKYPEQDNGSLAYQIWVER